MGTPGPIDLTPLADVKPPEARGLGDELRSVTRQLEIRSRELARSEARFRDVIERNADAIFVVDRAGAVRFANRAASQLCGQALEELVGSTFGFPVVVGETTEVDLVIRGTPRVAEMRVVLSEWEGAEAFIASLRDVTERNRAEQAARRLIREQAARAAAEESARRLHFLAQSSAVLSSSLDYSVTLSSLARLCTEELADWTVVYGLSDDGFPRRLDVAHRDPSKAALTAELRDMPFDPKGAHPVIETIRTRRPRLLREVSPHMLEAMSTNPRELELARTLGVASTMLVPIVARDRALGAISFVSSRAERVFGSNDLALAEDVAGRAALAIDNALLYEQAHQANQRKADFLAVVSHDLRTPLTAIIGYSDLLEMGVPEQISDGARERVDRIRTSAKHLLYLLNELLAFARLEASREEPQIQRMDIRAVARDVAEVLEPLANERQLRLQLQLPDQPVSISSDPDKVRQILLNLGGNAVKYTPRGEVRLSVREPQHDKVEVEITDTGDGIAANHLGHIFEPFWQADPMQRARGEGTGLGLSVVKHLVTFLGGAVTVDSTPGVGTTFTVSLPAK
jgi:signal transduction histidine kinase